MCLPNRSRGEPVSSEDIQSWLFTEAVPLRGKRTPCKGQYWSPIHPLEAKPHLHPERQIARIER